MALVNNVKKEINAKIVYVGIPGAGKGTNLNLLYRKLKPEHRGKLKTMQVQQDKMLFFDFTLPGLEQLGGYTVRIHVYTLVGEVRSQSAWQMVLKGVDGIVFVADSREEQLPANRSAFEMLKDHLSAYQVSIEEVSCVVQCNKRDMEPGFDMDTMLSSLGIESQPVIPAVASRGEGIFETLMKAVRLVIGSLQQQGLRLPTGVSDIQGFTETAPPVASTAESESALKEASVADSRLTPRQEEHGAVSSPMSGETEFGDVQTVSEPDHTSESILPESAPLWEIVPTRIQVPVTMRCGELEKTIRILVSISGEQE